MTKTDALRKLLALGPMRLDEIMSVTGWKLVEVKEAMAELERQKLLRKVGNYGETMRRYRLEQPTMAFIATPVTVIDFYQTEK